ncbi:hypothetical protein ACT4ML_18265 [Natrinema sp. LN54]|uniref:hypothetical protein n=1 Tax=Natrinema sp. LN54 TaxID=3458705 RepID=UPI004036276F
MATGSGNATATVTRWSRAFVAVGIGDRTARWSVTALLGGLGLEVSGSLGSVSPLVGAGRWLSVLGAALYAAVLWTIVLERVG